MDVPPVAAARLHHVHVLAAHVLQQLHARLLVGELGESARKVGNCKKVSPEVYKIANLLKIMGHVPRESYL